MEGPEGLGGSSRVLEGLIGSGGSSRVLEGLGGSWRVRRVPLTTSLDLPHLKYFDFHIYKVLKLPKVTNLMD